MEEKTFARLRDWVEPAHPAVVKLYDDLTAIYTRLREEFQNELNMAFDRVSRQVGFVVTTTIPVVFDVDNGKVKNISMGAENLKGTLFDKELSEVLKPLKGGAAIPKLKTGTYKLYVLWSDALIMKLRTDWMEPAHFFKASLIDAGIRSELQVRPEVMEPAHWFDPGKTIAVEDAVLIEAIDAVYPEIRLVDRVAAYRELLRKQVRPEVKEPAHFRPNVDISGDLS